MLFLLGTVLATFAIASPNASEHVEILNATGGLPPHVVGQFRQPSVFQQTSDGFYLVFDRRGHKIYRVERDRETVTTLVEIGSESGRIIGARSFDLGEITDRFAVADAPNGQERIQIFNVDGSLIRSFTLPGRARPRITFDDSVLSGVGTVEFTGREILMNQPELGGLITRFSLQGTPFHTFGVFRDTGHETERDVHLALNSGIPLASADGGYYFVFHAGVPLFRKYDVSGEFLFERRIQGIELDPIVNTLPTQWSHRSSEIPLIRPSVRTAAVDRDNNLWVALTTPFIYVYDSDGEKIRTISLRAAGLLQPSSLFFPDNTRMLVAPGCFEFKVW